MVADPANLAVAIHTDGSADLTWDAVTDPGWLDDSLYRRSPSTGGVFTPGVDTPHASGITTQSYADSGLVSASYDWQVVGRLWSPDDLPLLAWYDASVASSITSALGLVSQWSDLSGNARHLLSVGSPPTTGVDTINGLNVLKFSGLEFLRAAVTLAAANTVTCYLVVKPSGAGAYERALSLDSGGNDFDNTSSIAAILRDAGSGNFGSYYNGSMRAEKAMSNAAHVIVTQRSGDTSKVWVDGVAGTNATGLGTANFGITRIWIGSDATGSPLTGDVAECFISGAADSAPTVALGSAYLKNKFATP